MGAALPDVLRVWQSWVGTLCLRVLNPLSFFRKMGLVHSYLFIHSMHLLDSAVTSARCWPSAENIAVSQAVLSEHSRMERDSNKDVKYTVCQMLLSNVGHSKAGARRGQ